VISQYFTDQFKSQSGKSYTKSVIESKYSEQKKKFVALKTVLSLSGFGIDPASGVPTAPKAVMDAYIEAHPKIAFIFNKPLPNIELLKDLFIGKVFKIL
jgi:hypothetical protein